MGVRECGCVCVLQPAGVNRNIKYFMRRVSNELIEPVVLLYLYSAPVKLTVFGKFERGVKLPSSPAVESRRSFCFVI